MKKSAFFTGHRDYSNLESGINCLINYAISNHVNHFYVGMALGTDLIAAKLLCERSLEWTAVIPFPNQTERWKGRDAMLYEQLLPFSIERVTLFEKYHQQAYHVRNDYMIERSQLCLAVYDGRSHGGTASVIRKVQNLGKNLMLYDPKTGGFTKQLNIA